MVWHDYVGNPYAPDHADRRSSQEALAKLLHAVGVVHGEPISRAFTYKAKADEDKVTGFKIDGVQVYVEVQRDISQIARRVFTEPSGFELPDGGL